MEMSASGKDGSHEIAAANNPLSESVTEKSCPFCKQICDEKRILEHIKICDQNTYECPLCSQVLPEKDKGMHEGFFCKVLLNIQSDGRYPDMSQSKSEISGNNRAMRNVESGVCNNEACPECKNSFPKLCLEHHLQICKNGVSPRFPYRTGVQNKGDVPKNQVKLEHEPESINCIKCSVCEAYVPVKDIENHYRSHESKRCCHNKKDEQKSIEEKDDLMKKDKTTDEVSEKCPKLTGVDKLATDLKNLLITEEDNDVSIKVKDREFKAHKSILRVRSSVFYSMFKHDMAEKSSGTVEIVDCDPEAFQIFLQYLYTGHVGDLSNDIALNLYCVADKYDAEEVKEKCVECMMHNLSVETFCDVAAFALKHNESALLETVTEFFRQYAKEIIVTVKWLSFLKENIVAANEFHIKAMEN